MREQPDWPPQVAYSEVRRRVSLVTHVRWNTIELMIDPTVRTQLSFDA